MSGTKLSEQSLPGTILLAGPTASGKSALAMEIAKEFDGVIINADSMQIYDGLRVLSARPSVEDEARVPHRLYGILEPSELCTAARWRDMALEEIRRCHNEGKVPVLTGGTGLYFETLIHGIAPVPTIPDDIRSETRRKFSSIGNEAFHAYLGDIDPPMAFRLKVGDSQRMMRAAEVMIATGQSLLKWQENTGDGPVLETPRLWLALTPERQWLYDRCDQRLDWMLDQGDALKEVALLMKRGVDPSLPVMKALGVPELIAVIEARESLDYARQSIKTNTRRYAKRQLTWIRNKMSEAKTSSAKDLESFKADFFPFILKFLLTRDK